MNEKELKCNLCGQRILTQQVLQSGNTHNVCDCNIPATKGQVRELKNLILDLGKYK